MRPAHLLGVLALLSIPLGAQVEYRLAFEPGEGSHWEVEARFPHPRPGDLDVWMARWTGGAYHLADFGRFVSEFTATSEDGTPLEVESIEDGLHRIRAAATGDVVVRYRADSLSSGLLSDGVLDVEANRIRSNYAYGNPPSLFAFVPDLLEEEVLVEVRLPEGWKAATALERTPDGRFRAPNYFRFEDSPLLFGPDLRTRTFEVDGKPHAVTVLGRDEAAVDRIAEGCQRIVEATGELLEGLPYERYHFLIAFVPEAGGSGLEHANSTLILVHPAMGDGFRNLGFWGVVAHEYFHLWTPERISVEGLHHPDLTRPFTTSTIWFNEGLTEYFTRHVLFHAGFQDETSMLEGLTRPFPPGPRSKPWTQVSREAVDWTEGERFLEFAQAMYGTGPQVVLALDLEMRGASGGERGLIDLLRYLRYAYADLDRGFPEGTLPAMINGIAQKDLSAFFERYIDGTEYPDLNAGLEVLGLTIENGRIVELEPVREGALRAREDFLSIPD